MDILGGADATVTQMTLSGASLNLDGNSNDAFPPLTFLADASAWVELEDQFRNSELPTNDNSQPTNTNYDSIRIANTWTFTQNETSDMLVNSGTSHIQTEQQCSTFARAERDEVFPFDAVPVAETCEANIVDPVLKGEGLGFGRISSSEADRMEVARIMEQLKKGWDGTSALNSNANDERRLDHQRIEYDHFCRVEQQALSINLTPLFSTKLKDVVLECIGKDCTSVPVQLRFPFGVLCIVIPTDQLWTPAASEPAPPPPPAAPAESGASIVRKPVTGVDYDHYLDADGKKRFRCCKCYKDYYSKAALQVHFRTHTNSRPFSCSKCRKSFKQAGHLATHEMIHRNERKFCCPKCPASFIQRHQLIRHKNNCLRGQNKSVDKPRAEPVVETPIVPEGKELKSAESHSDEAEHVEIAQFESSPEIIDVGQLPTTSNDQSETSAQNNESEPVRKGKKECGSCGKWVFKLKRHVRLVHGGDARPCICSECGAEFKTMQHLKQHMVSHSETFAFACPLCHQRFKLASHLKRHLFTVHFEQTNSGPPKPYVCKKCGKAFARKDGLTDHEALHEDASYPCDECGLKFKQERTLRCHKSTMHPADDSIFLVKCPHCDQQFTRIANLRRHTKTACKGVNHANNNDCDVILVT